MKMKIHDIINEQFNISNMDFGNNKKINKNIFNKNVINPEEILKKILSFNPVEEYIIKYLNDLTAEVKI